MNESVMVTCRIPKELREQLNAQADKDGFSSAAIMRNLIKQYVLGKLKINLVNEISPIA